MEVKFYKIHEIDDSLLKYAVIISKYRGKWVFCKHKNRDTWEVPGGHRESGETILQAAKRELFEETGAVEFDIKQICIYSINSYGMLFYADIHKFEDLPETEIEKIDFFDELPKNLTYPLFHPKFIDKVVELLK
ncbi:MAG: NUDIX domain-containing protein [Defluviitaleaceae bacterium]|nr:NUDIX domain-containing protein [Defluviitaleaceae bacterium]